MAAVVASKIRDVSFALIAGLTVLAACKSGTAVKPVAVPAATGADGGAGAAVFATTPPPSGLPPAAAMPPPGVAGSKKAKVKADGGLAACGGQSAPHAKDPGDLVKKIGEGCAATSKMKPVGAMLRGAQADKDAHQDQKFRAEASHCYRVYFATDEAVKDVIVVLRDSAGDVIAEAPGPSAPQSGAACFSAADEVTLTVGIGSGKGAWAAQVWSD